MTHTIQLQHPTSNQANMANTDTETAESRLPSRVSSRGRPRGRGRGSTASAAAGNLSYDCARGRHCTVSAPVGEGGLEKLMEVPNKR